MAIPAGQIMRYFGYKAGLVTGLILMGSGCWLFWPAAKSDVYLFFVAAQFVIGCGLSFLETGANSFIAQLGPTASSERRLNLSQAFNPLGSITAGLVGTVFIFSGVEFSSAENDAGVSALGDDAGGSDVPGAGVGGIPVGADGADDEVSRSCG
jgi:FHS family L-fucose permease-like MFS transporter